MPLNKLENFIKNTEGRILYVNPNDLDSTDAITNQGNSLAQPFKTIQRALIESARFSYLRGNNNDTVEKTTILCFPGEHIIDNRPGYAIRDDSGTAKVIPPSGGSGAVASTSDMSLTLSSNFDITQDDNVLYKFNSIDGGVVIPRGTSIVGLDLRKTKIRPKYVPNPTDSSVSKSAIFRVTGSCYFFQFTFFDGDDTGLVYTDSSDFSANNQSKPTFSHHKLTCFEYADGITVPAGYSITDLDMYYSKLSNAFNTESTRNIDQKYPSSADGFAKQRPEWEIVGAFATDPITISKVISGDGYAAGQIVTVTTSTEHGLNAGTPIKIKGVTTPDYNISTVVQSVNNTTQFTYLLPFVRDTLPPAPGVSSASVTIETDTVSGASPYIFNCSLRSVWGMNGMKADGSKASGFKSMVVAQFTGVSLQKDDRAFVKYNQSSRAYESITVTLQRGSALAQGSSSLDATKVYHLDSDAIYRNGWEGSHIKITNDAVLQIVSVFAIGYNKHFDIQSGSDASITNSNSNFGQISLAAEGFKVEAFDKDDAGYITNIITPKAITTKNTTIDWVEFDVVKTKAVGISSHVYLYGYEDQDDSPSITLRGYRLGAKTNDIVSVDIGGVKTSPLYMTGGGTTVGEKSYTVTTGPSYIAGNASLSNIFTVGAHNIQTGESVRIVSDDADLPENIEDNNVYYAIRHSNTQIKLASSKTNADNGKAVTVFGGTKLQIISRVHDKESGDIGAPIQWDSTNNQWYVHLPGTNDVYTAINALSSVDKTKVTYITRQEDPRSLDEKIYKMRVVIPKESVNAKDPNEGFVIQESSTTGARSNSDFTISTIDGNDYGYNRNPRFISTCSVSGNSVTVVSELPHNLNVNDLVTIKNVTSSTNTVGAASSGYNSTFAVTSIDDDKTFKYATTDTVGVTHNPGLFNNDISNRTTTLPRFNRNDLKSNFYVYRNETISPYIRDVQDGIYHIFVLKSDNKVTTEFTNLSYGQNVENLYPQQDKDNANDNPPASVSYAKRSPLGDVSTNELKNSITREAADKFLKDIGIGHAISSVLTDTTAGISTLTFARAHAFSGIATHTNVAGWGGANYIPTSGISTYYNVKLLNGGSNPLSGSTWNGATATVTVNNGAIVDADIMNSGSGYSAADLYFDQTVVGAGNGNARYRVTTNSLKTNVNDVVQVSGIGTVTDGVYRITSVPSSSTIAIAITAGDPGIIATQYVLPVGPSAAVASDTYDTTTGISTFTCSTGHGLVSGNKFRVVDSSNNNKGDFYVKERLSVTKFSAVTNENLVPSRILSHGMGAASATSDDQNENIGSRGLSFYDGDYVTLGAAAGSGSSLQITIPSSGIGTVSRLPLGSYVQVDNEIMRVTSSAPTGGGFNQITVIRGSLGTNTANHLTGSIVKKIKPLAIEFRRPSIIRASGHTFEYLGYGPGNYSTGLPQVQVRTLSEREEFLSQAQERSCGAVVYTGMNNDGDFYIGNKKVSSATGQETTFDAPIPTVTGQDPSKLSVVFDEVVIKDRLIVEGGTSDRILSQFDGPVTFNQEVRVNNDVTITGDLKVLQSLIFTSDQQSNDKDTGAIITEGGLGVEKNTNIGGHLAVTGITTFTGAVDANGGASIDNVQIGVSANGEIDTSTGDLTLDSAGGTVNIDDVLTVTGVVNASSTTASTSGSSGALVVTGGVGIGGELHVTGDITAFSTSDINMKSNITVIPNALDKVKALRGTTFTWNDNATEYMRGVPDTGCIAQEVEALGLPGITSTRDLTDAVGYGDTMTELKTLDYKRLVPLLIEAVKELSAKVDALS